MICICTGHPDNKKNIQAYPFYSPQPFFQHIFIMLLKIGPLSRAGKTCEVAANQQSLVVDLLSKAKLYRLYHLLFLSPLVKKYQQM